MFRDSGQTDIVLGCPVSTRTTVESEQAIGYFLNTLVIRTELESTDATSSVFDKTAANIADSLRYKQVPFSRVMDTLGLQHQGSYAPAFQIMFVLENYPDHALEINGVKVQARRFETKTSKFDMTISATVQGGALLMRCAYNTTLYGRDRIENLMTQYVDILRELGQQDERAVVDAGVRKLGWKVS
jgi:non-ribosomal peptide synthetase component F